MKTSICRRWITACLVAPVALLIGGVGSAVASPVNGTWIVRDLVLQIFDCQRGVCGRIVGIKNASKRRSQCGMTIVWGLEAKGPNEWSGGSILDPDDNTVYRLSANFEADGTLHARIFKGIPIFGKTEVLKRVNLPSFTGQC